MITTRIKEIRISKGILQGELARKVGLSQPEVSRKENGLTSIDIKQLKVFATALEVPISALLDDTTTLKAVGE